METHKIQPYFHPTTVVFVDDDSNFLDNLSLQLDAHLAYRLLSSPNNALGQLNNSAHSRPLSERFFATIMNNRRGAPTEPVLRLDLAAIQKEVRNTQRFAELAVVVVDYAMPEMNGLEFCKQVGNPHIKKILFTGVADEDIALHAFNTGVIDRFIRKSERNVYEDVNTAILELQNAYIRDTAQTISHVLALQKQDYLTDPVFASFFNELREKHGFIEYYMSTEPGGFLLLDADGHTARLVVLTGEELNLHIRVAQSRGAPQALLDALASNNTVPFFGSAPDGFFNTNCTNVFQCLHTAAILDGRQRYYWALVPDSEIATDDTIASYNSYLDWLDTTAYGLI